MRIILGSQSPRRKELLTHIIKEFEIVVKPVEENYPADLPKQKIAGFLAEKKAKAFNTEDFTDDLIITADTTVVLDNALLEKAADKQEAIGMLEKLSGREHAVISAACILFRGETYLLEDETKVFFKTLTEKEMNYYIDQYQPYDKAGAYGIQEWIGMIGIEKIEGSYFNVVGMPVHKLYAQLVELGVL